MVSIGTNGLPVRRGCWPAAIATIIVSPIARDTARMNAAVMPEKAAGTTTLSAVCMRVAPSAYEPSRKSARHRAHRILGERRHQRQDHQPHHQARD